MTGQAPNYPLIKLVSRNNSASPILPYTLSKTQKVVMGRDPSCEIILDSTQYGMVSRRHAELRPLAGGWEICDLNSANGTYINSNRLQGCKRLNPGDQIILGDKGPEFVFEDQPPVANYQAPSPNQYVNPTNASVQSDNVSITQLFPIFSTGRDLTRKAYLVPGIITVSFVVLMFASVGKPVVFNLVLAAYLAGAAYYFVYQLCGKYKPWWMIVGAALLTMIILISPILNLFIVFFRQVLPGNVPRDINQLTFPILLVRMFFGAGLMEELLKALPVFLAYLIGKNLRSSWRDRIGVWEPLDGILLGAASAVGFTLLETLGQYVPGIIHSVSMQSGNGTGELLGLQLLIPRIIGSVAGHIAYSGYFGYFIGLSALKPRQGWLILGIGYLTAASLHALWNSTAILGLFAPAIVGVLSYAFLTAAILKARTLSPTRSQNFATRFIGRP